MFLIRPVHLKVIQGVHLIRCYHSNFLQVNTAYEITLFNRNYEPVPMMKIPDEAWIGLYNYFVELYTRWENSSGCRAY